MPDLEPITREEKLWSGEDIEPITREEMYIKHIFDKTQPIPSKPLTRKEMLLEKAGEGGGSDVTIKQLSVTANGTYSEEGTAYSPVIVNVPMPPIPDNAYLLNEVEGLPSDIATFTDGSNLPLASLKVGIEPIQEGSGDPSPSNVRPISGWTEEVITRTGKNLLNPTIKKYSNPFVAYGGTIESNVPDGSLVFKAGTYTISINEDVPTIEVRDNPNSIIKTGRGNSLTFTLEEEKAIKIAINKGSADIDSLTFQLEVGSTATTYEPYAGTTTTINFVDGQGQSLTVYNGNIEVISGSLTDNRDKNFVDFSTVPIIKNDASNPNDYLYYIPSLPVDKNKEIICSHAPFLNSPPVRNTLGIAVSGSGSIYINLTSDVMTTNTVEYLKQYCINNNVQILYTTTSTPTTYPQHPTSINSLDGENNVWCDTGKIEELEYFSKEV